MTAILALPEMPPTFETPPESAEGEAQAETSFSAVLAAVEDSDTESTDEEIELDETPAPVVTHALPPALQLFALFEGLPDEVVADALTAPAAVGAEPSPLELTNAAPPPVSNPVAFELEVRPTGWSESAATDEPAAEAPDQALSTTESIATTAEKGERRTSVPSVAPEQESFEIDSRDPADGTAPTAEPAGDSRSEPSLARLEIGAAKPEQRSAQPLKIQEVALPPEPPRAVESPRVAVRLEAREGLSTPPVDVVVAQRGGSLHFSVHSADGRLGAEMRTSLGDLTERLEMLGYRATPVAASERVPAVREPAASERSWTDGGNSPGSGSTGDEKRQGRRNRNQWRLEMENQTQTAGGAR